MDTHVRLLGFLNIALGVTGALLAVVVLVIFGGIAGLIGFHASPEDGLVGVPIVSLVGGALVVFTLIISVPLIVGGYGLLNYRPWARTLIIIVSAINLLNVPLGTVLGVYGLWVLLAQETEPLFDPLRQPAPR